MLREPAHSRSARAAAIGLAICLATLACSGRLVQAQNAPEGLRQIEVKNFGVVVNAPLAWKLIRWGQDDHAFVLSLPQEEGSPAGRVSCDLAMAPETLADYRRQNEAANDEEWQRSEPRRKLTLNEIEPLDEKRYGKERADKLRERLVSLWEYAPENDVTRFEMTVRVLANDLLYTLTLQTDEAHFAAYRLDFEELLTTAELSPAESGLRPIAGGFWLQREYLIAMRLPANWKPAFGPSDKVLLFARGAAHNNLSDHLLVLASPPKPLDLEVLKENAQAAAAKEDPDAKVQACKIVRQGAAGALETIIQTKRGKLDVTVLNRQFRSTKRNYEVKCTVESGEFQKIEAELRKALDSFQEVTEKTPESVL